MGTVSVCKAVLRSQCPFRGVVVTGAPEGRDVQHLNGELVHGNVLQIRRVQLVDHGAYRAVLQTLIQLAWDETERIREYSGT
jgi:hypothetical protein